MFSVRAKKTTNSLLYFVHLPTYNRRSAEAEQHEQRELGGHSAGGDRLQAAAAVARDGWLVHCAGSYLEQNAGAPDRVDDATSAGDQGRRWHQVHHTRVRWFVVCGRTASMVNVKFQHNSTFS